ncbi:MAG: hypothetical protein M3005_05105 [Apilactobacillus sp.]|uniref:hypothetical protein n=1 Tax=Apilactobacillus TaxID=2767877 RepID=UPI0025D8CE54|nr:hypothetical protein [Apilactobacillus sp.]MCT6823240.1 hypothetical protein [Apilactobacillus sp.]
MITRKEYQSNKKKKHLDDDFISRSQSDDDVISREEVSRNNTLSDDDKIKRLSRRLNWTIAFLILLIIAVYLILIYVNP